MNNNIKKIILLVGDIAVLYLTLYLTLLIRYAHLPTEQLWSMHFAPFTIMIAGWLIIFYISRLYDLRWAVNDQEFFSRTARALLISSLLSAAFFYLMPNVQIAPKTNLIIYIFVFILLFFLWRRFFNWLLSAYLPKNSIIIIGFNEQVRELIQEFKNRPHLGYSISFIVDDQATADRIYGLPIITQLNGLPQRIEEHKINTIVFTPDPHQSRELRIALFDCLPLKINYFSLPRFYEMITGKIPLETINQMWFLENLSEGSKAWFDTIKRFCDIILSANLLIVSIIFWPLIAIMVKIDSKGPAFFKQVRTGKDGKPFMIVKFRTMRVDGNDFQPTLSKDLRITRLGSILRKTRLDELPQLLNILKGEMSFVGPRPERPELIGDLEKNIPFYRQRMLVHPGITGWDQVSGEYHSPSIEDSWKKLQYDLFYIKNRSLYLDASIILKTIATVLSREGR